MTNQNKADHWGDLASILGAEVREEEPVQDVQPGGETEPEAKDEPVCTPPTKTVAREERPRRAPSDWDALASSLGLETPPEPAKESVEDLPPRPRDEEPESSTVSAEEQEVEPAPAVSMTELAETVESLSDRVKTAPWGLEHEPTFRIAQEQEAEEVSAEVDREEVADEPAAEEETPSRAKSKRRRRRRSRPGDKAAVSESAEEPAEAVAESQPEEAEAGETESEGRHRSKRRRPRRRRQKAESPDKTRPDAMGDDDADDIFDQDDLESDSGSGKAGHRSIPVWQEAISIIVEKNLESRAKKPDGGASQKRGGRRSGRRGRG